jgi:TRAP-type C4-dicarboxylate transport system substrate-binding protein
VAAFEAFGANATPIAYSEMYSALQTGVVDGADAANTNYYAKKFYEVAPYWAMVGWLTSLNPVVMAESKFQSLPEDIRTILLEVSTKNGRENRELYAETDASVLEKLVAEGVKVTHPDVAPFREAALGIYDRFLKTDREKELLRLVQESK